MRRLSGTAISIMLLPGPGLAQGSFPAIGPIRGDVFTKGTNGEPAVLPGVHIVLHGRITKKAESDAQGAFAIERVPPGSSEIEADAPGLYAALSAEVSAAISATIPVEINSSAVTSSTPPQLPGLKAMDYAFSRKVRHA